MKTVEEKNSTKKVEKRFAKRIQLKRPALKTEPPLSEKDEVKKAEEKMRHRS